jgi:hypothetical protein
MKIKESITLKGSNEEISFTPTSIRVSYANGSIRILDTDSCTHMFFNASDATGQESREIRLLIDGPWEKNWNDGVKLKFEDLKKLFQLIE